MLRSLPFLIVLLLVSAGSSSAQFFDITNGDIFFTDIPGCDGNLHDFSIRGLSETNTSYEFTATIDGRSRTFVISLNQGYTFDTLDDRILDFDNEEDLLAFMEDVIGGDWTSYVQFAQAGLGCNSLGLGSGAVVTADPLVNQNISTFRNVAFNDMVLPKGMRSANSAAEARTDNTSQGSEEESGSGRPLLLTEVSSDMEYERFDVGSASGDNFAIRGGFARVTPRGDMAYGLNGFFNRLSLGAGDPSNYYVLQGFLNKYTSQTLNGESYVGLTVNAVLPELGENSFGIGLHAVQKRFMGDSMFMYGAMFQSNMAGDLNANYANMAVLYGFPVGDNLSINLDMLAVFNVYTAFDGEKIESNDRLMLNPSVTATYYPSPSFGLNVGVKTVLLVENYSSFELVVGSRFRF